MATVATKSPSVGLSILGGSTAGGAYAQAMQWASQAHSKALKALQRQHKALRQQVAQEVQEEMLAEPVYLAWHLLTTPASEGNQAIRLDRDSIATQYGKDSELYQKLKRYRMLAKAGMSAIGVAENVTKEVFQQEVDMGLARALIDLGGVMSMGYKPTNHFY